MYLYFLFIRIAALFGHRKAKLMVQGQKAVQEAMRSSLQDLRGAIWFHVSSVGEFEQARPIIEQLKSKNSKYKIVLTFFSPSGYEMRKNYDQADAVLYLPFATRRNARRFLDALQPKMAIFVKYEFWPAYLKELKKRDIPTFSICAIFRPEQLFFKPWGRWYLNLLRCFTRLYVQDEASLQLLQSHGISQCSIGGDTRFDRMWEVKEKGERLKANEERLMPVELFTEHCQQVIIAGSSWPKDEVLLAQYMKNDHTLIANSQKPKLILVPHELDEKHLHFIFNLFEGRIVRYSDVYRQPTQEAQRNVIRYANVMVVDTMGLLSSLYRFGQVAYIGGGFGAGIHNTIEAAAYGMPVLFGPNYHHFREAKALIAAGAARSIRNDEELESALNHALDHYPELGAKAAAYVQTELGATEKIYQEIFNK